VDIHIAAPQGPERGLTRQQVLDLLAKSGLQVEYEGRHPARLSSGKSASTGRVP